MKNENVNNELVFGNRNNTSSHYRINSGGFKVQLMATLEGNKPSEQTEYLMCQIGHRHVFIAAYMKGNGYVKLFTLRSFIEWVHHSRPARSVDITQDEYDNDTSLESVIERNFLSF